MYQPVYILASFPLKPYMLRSTNGFVHRQATQACMATIHYGVWFTILLYFGSPYTFAIYGMVGNPEASRVAMLSILVKTSGGTNRYIQ